MTTRTTILTALIVAVAIPVHADEPLTLIPYTPSSFGDAVFLEGMPIDITVSVVNQAAREIEAAEQAAWLEEARNAERTGTVATPRTKRAVVPIVELGADNVGWFDDVAVALARETESGSVRVLDGIDWSARRVAPARVEKPVALGHDPASVTCRIGEGDVAGLEPGRYRVSVSKPGANAGEAWFEVRRAETEAEIAFVAHEAAREALRLGDYDRAIELAASAEGKLLDNPDLVYDTLGFAHELRGDVETAVAHYERFLETYEDSEIWTYPALVRERTDDLKRRVRRRGER